MDRGTAVLRSPYLKTQVTTQPFSAQALFGLHSHRTGEEHDSLHQSDGSCHQEGPPCHSCDSGSRELSISRYLIPFVYRV